MYVMIEATLSSGKKQRNPDSNLNSITLTKSSSLNSIAPSGLLQGLNINLCKVNNRHSIKQLLY